MASKLQQVQSTLVTLNDIVEQDYFFNIPIYQRLYVWGKNQIETLLSDIWEACKEDKAVFYLGGTLVIEREVIGRDNIENSAVSTGRFFDLIDGQQRFTTLWLISLAWQQALQDYRYQDTADGLRHRIHFAIRPQVKRFFEAQIAGRPASLPEARQLEDAMAIIENFAIRKAQDNDPLDIPKLTRFIYEKVKLVFTEVPENTDLNKLFEVINNRGVQLQHHEILKARLLGKLTDPQQRECYGQLWDACSYMGDYVEKNLKLATDIRLTDYFENSASGLDAETLASAPKVLKALDSLLQGKEETALSLSDILEGSPVEAEAHAGGKDDDYESDKVRSIITFPMLLQHVLRIWLVNKDRADILKILDKDLIAIFEQSWLNEGIREPEVKSFIKLLWEVRYRFDKYIIKWVEDEDDEVHAIRRLRKNKNTSGRSISYSLSRDSSDSRTGFALLQSMLYHSQQMTTQYWLTPLLKYILDHPGDDAFLYLKYLDNQLFCTDRSSPLIQRTRKPLEDPFALKRKRCFEALEEPLGVGFPHYWFYKLEFVLWSQLKDQKGDVWKNFRITARNSVEHISPQTPEQYDTNRVSEKALDSFGNLALVSRSLNYEYSNLPFNEKRQRFLNKNRTGVDSLKMSLIYEHQQWDDDLVKQHQTEMKERLIAYYRSVRKEIRKHLGGSQ